MDESKAIKLIQALLTENNEQRLEIDKLKIELSREKEKSILREV